ELHGAGGAGPIGIPIQISADLVVEQLRPGDIRRRAVDEAYSRSAKISGGAQPEANVLQLEVIEIRLQVRDCLDAPAAADAAQQESVLAPPARDRVFAAAAPENVGRGIANDRIVAVAGIRVLDHGARLNGDGFAGNLADVQRVEVDK